MKKLGFTQTGYNKLLDITACPGTDTCNLGISSSTGIAVELEKVIANEYQELITTKDITIKISGCMNACGQHNMAEIGFQGMTIKSGKFVAPALQVLLGGGIIGDGKGRFSDKVLKIPSKRGPEALRKILDDYKANANPEEPFLDYYDRQGKTYFYHLLTYLSNIENLTEDDFIDWGHTKPYVSAVGIGECAGVVIDLIATLLVESQEKIQNASDALADQLWSDSIYHSYTSIINSAKALLLSEQKQANSQASIISQFDEVFVSTKKIEMTTTFSEFVYQIQEKAPTETFAQSYLQDAKRFLQKIETYRKGDITNA